MRNVANQFLFNLGLSPVSQPSLLRIPELKGRPAGKRYIGDEINGLCQDQDLHRGASEPLRARLGAAAAGGLPPLLAAAACVAAVAAPCLHGGERLVCQGGDGALGSQDGLAP